MQLHQLRYVVAVAEYGHFTRAAERLHVAQPSVSTAVRALERELGVPLFHRSRGTVSLTAAGEAFLPWARQVLADCESAQAAVRELLGLRGGRLAVGATPSLTTNLLPPLLVDFHRRHPGIALAVHEAGSQDLVSRLEQGELDVALIILPIEQPWVSTTSLVEEELVLAVHHGHPLIRRRSISIDELRDVPLVMFRDGYDLREVTTEACRRAGFGPVAAVDGLEMDGVVALTSAGLGASVLPASVVHQARRSLHAVRFEGRVLTRTVGLAARRDRPLSQAARAFVEAVRHGVSGADGAVSSAVGA